MSFKMNVLYCFAICVVLPLIVTETLKFHPRSHSKSNLKMTDGELAMLLEQYLVGGHKATNLKDFVFKSCGGNTDSIFNLTISPDPIVFPGVLTVDAHINLKQEISTPLMAQLTVQRKVGGIWIEVPCITNIGSCTYEKLCEDLESVTCPASITELCHCPIKAKTYSVHQTFEVDATVFPVGDYNVTAKVTFGPDGKYSQCIDALFTIGY
ncbi:ganglioside GM2 activator-like [Pecten maximus]|uniref:ganglioside GM2 activator-like n=1 Tax=Pecten maximus TaxID=6579 RepID=UPI001457FF64|nr:ganglioside GM2 activator-like [Pecten maximus]